MADAYQIKNQEGMYYLTLQVVNWLDVFTRQKYRDIIIESLTYCRKEKGLQIFSYVIMSNHVHIIVRAERGYLSAIMRDLKKFTSSQILKEIQISNESRKEWLLQYMSDAANKHKRNKNYQLWTHENHAVELTDNSMIDQRVEYIHNNPVVAGIVENPEDYLYSSARNFANMEAILEIDVL